MKERPIIMSGPMVRAILEGRKTQTRRVAKPFNPPEFAADEVHEPYKGKFFGWMGEKIPDIEFTRSVYLDKDGIECPYGQPGDRLWVRETWQFDETEYWYVYRADIESFADAAFGPPTWKPSILMPRSAARILLEITDIRVERLQDISEADAYAEGIEWWYEERMKSRPKHHKIYYQENPNDPDFYASNPIDSYSTLWRSINGPESWEKTPGCG